jgi:galactokinase/mevalonate kinase-like predicted kinase
MHESILKNDKKTFLELVSAGWEEKKKTGKILENENVVRIDKSLSSSKEVLAHRLLGAGNGGFFLVFADKNTNLEDSELKTVSQAVKVSVCSKGPQAFEME